MAFIQIINNNKYDHNGFDIKGFHKDTKNLYDTNGFNINGTHVITNDKYDHNGFNRNTDHKDTKTSSKELIHNIEQLINDSYDNKQITKQVYNNLIKAITYK